MEPPDLLRLEKTSFDALHITCLIISRKYTIYDSHSRGNAITLRLANQVANHTNPAPSSLEQNQVGLFKHAAITAFGATASAKQA